MIKDIVPVYNTLIMEMLQCEYNLRQIKTISTKDKL